MAANGSRGPRPYMQHRASTLFVRVPWHEWPEVKLGFKRVFRGGSGKASNLLSVPTPVPVVAYAISSLRQYRAALMVLERCWREPLGAISPESLEAEGYETFAEFRRAWVLREKRYFPPLAMATAYRVRPWAPEDAREMAEALLRRLYGDWLDEPTESFTAVAG